MSEAIHPAAIHHLPGFITAPGQSDWLLTAVAVFLIVSVFALGTIYLRLHSLPELMAHKTNKIQLELVAVLALLSLLTHNNILWGAALLLALIDLPDFSSPLSSISRSLERIAGKVDQPTVPEARDVEAEPLPLPRALPGHPSPDQPSTEGKA
ncbi:hypothetical protein JVX98_09320 [Ensifer sp. PDNC004]|uniref:hypothetical protein n=1 Tax=unclassified Ensifer TaxID=2633371 RepID=UPI0017862620|nr:MULTISPECIES: hypothetical protein [unclassified Ensifer]MBD9647705.1 hypothetical protein [Ensifer sp. ENS09]QRY68457.1 hypothetical protein JVX98_09320 [Ensifer sp. PDNC004]